MSTPSRIASFLRHIASELDRSQAPSLKLVTADLRRAIAMTGSEFDLPTADLVKKMEEVCKGLGFPISESSERWEGDGVVHVGPPNADPNHHWYLEISGNDNEHYDAGVTLVVIMDPASGAKEDLQQALNSPDELAPILKEQGFLQ